MDFVLEEMTRSVGEQKLETLLHLDPPFGVAHVRDVHLGAQVGSELHCRLHGLDQIEGDKLLQHVIVETFGAFKRDLLRLS